MDRAGQQATDTEIAGVIARPPLLFLGALLVGFVSDHLSLFALVLDRLSLAAPPTLAGDVVHRVTAAVPIVVGLTFVIAGIRNFSRARTPVPTYAPTRALVTTGVHGWTRNPIYLGLFLMYAGIGMAVRSPSILFLALPLAIVIRYGVVAREEAYLERRFGDAYRHYKTRVRRWL